jgi:transposase-like protein
VGHQSLYPEEFRRDAVALYRAAEGKRTYAVVAADLGISGETLRTWVRKDTARNARSEDHGTAGGETETDDARAPAGRECSATRYGEGFCAGQPRISHQCGEVKTRRWDFISAHPAPPDLPSVRRPG